MGGATNCEQMSEAEGGWALRHWHVGCRETQEVERIKPWRQCCGAVDDEKTSLLFYLLKMRRLGAIVVNHRRLSGRKRH
jgi:hypothetical protein